MSMGTRGGIGFGCGGLNPRKKVHFQGHNSQLQKEVARKI